MRAPDALNPGFDNEDWAFPDHERDTAPCLSVYPPEDEEPAAELLGPDGERLRVWRRNPIGYHEENGRG